MGGRGFSWGLRWGRLGRKVGRERCRNGMGYWTGICWMVLLSERFEMQNSIVREVCRYGRKVVRTR